MWAFLIIFSFLAFAVGGLVLVSSTTVFQEMLAGMLMVISAILFSGGGIIYEIRQLRKDIEKADGSREEK